MEISIQAPKDWLREIKVEVESDRLRSKLEELYQKYGSKALIPGFRPGKAPRHVLEKRLGSSLEAVAVEEIVEQTTSEVLEQHKLRLAARARIHDLEVLPDKTVRFTIHAEVFPDFQLKDCRGLKLKREEPTGFEAEFERRLKALQEQCATFTPVSRPAQEQDFVSCDYQIFDGDKPAGPARTNVMLQVGNQANLTEINSILQGVRPGDEREATVEFPPDHPDKNLAGKKLTFKFKIREVKEKHLPEIDEQFAYDLGYESLDALRQELNEQIMQDRARLVANNLKDQIFDLLVREHDFEPPESWVRATLEQLAREYELPDDEETAAKLRVIATRRAKFDIIAARIAELEKIEVNEEEIRSRIEDLAQKANRPVTELEPLLDNPVFRNQVLREKIMDFILEKADVS